MQSREARLSQGVANCTESGGTLNTAGGYRFDPLTGSERFTPANTSKEHTQHGV